MKITTPKGTLESIEAILEKYGRDCLRDADLSGFDLSHADLTNADLTNADLSGADLTGANLSYANLTGANLSRACLIGANLTGADLSRACLLAANLRGADLTKANMMGADLRSADMMGADLTKANMMGADLRSADMMGADLTKANMMGAEGADLIMAQTRILPDGGDIIGWKKAWTVDDQPIIVKLLIPSDAQRSNGMGRRCRASEAKVLDLQDLAGHSIATVAYSAHDPEFAYRLGETVESDGFDPDRWAECTDGIHFFITRIEAVGY
ncbi:MAG: pentapeptide repeat-containing protein [Bifidobacterium bifidum]|nr:pentapeptide repeat-containing protein [Bifidobacterium bifidum]